FSSRRRHTRFSRDWSSDVCSSDLVEVARAPFERAEVAIEAGEGQELLAAAWAGDDSIAYLVRDADGRVSLRRETGDRTDILLEEIGRASCREGGEGAEGGVPAGNE